MRKYCKALVNLSVAFLIVLFIIFLFPKIIVFFSPFVAGWIIALIAGPAVGFLERKLKIRRKAGSAFTIVIVIALVVLIIYLVGAKLGEEIVGLVEALPDIWKSFEVDIQHVGEKLDVIYERLPRDMQDRISMFSVELSDSLSDLFGMIGSPTITAVGNFAKSLPSIIIAIIMSLLSSYFFVADRKEVNEWFKKAMPKSLQSRYDILRRSLVKAVGGYFKAQLKIEFWIYLILLCGFLLLRIDYAALICLGIAFLDFLPFFGTGTVMVPWAIIKFLNSEYKIGIWLLIIWGVGQLVRQIIQPKIVGDSIGMPPIPTLFLLFIGYKIGGVLGMILAVPIGIIVYTMYKEGAFDTTKNSILILFAGINRFRKLSPDDIPKVEEK